MKVGDLVKFPDVSPYWWSNRVGIVDIAGPDPKWPDAPISYRVIVEPGKYVRFGDPDFAEIISESR